MDIDVYVENVIIDDSPVYVVYPEDEIYSEVVGVAESQEERCELPVPLMSSPNVFEKGVQIII